MLNWITPNVQKVVAMSFVVSWYLAQGRFTLFWQALSGQVAIASSTSSGPSTAIPGAPGGGGGGNTSGPLIA